jgi:hypothetical protein
MESYKEIKAENLTIQLKNDFPIKELYFGEQLYGGVIPLIFVSFDSLTDLENNWKDFNSQIINDIVLNLIEEYSRWNLYVFYFSDIEVPKSLKYEIENNKFSSRKILIENCKSITNTFITNVISEHITNDNIQINADSKQTSTFKKNASLAKIVDKLKLTRKNDDALQNALNQIENTYKDEI